MHYFTRGLGFPEAPLFMPDGSLMIVEMGEDKGCLTRLDSTGAQTQIVCRTGRPNGLALDRYGDIWIAETARRAVLALRTDGRLDTVADRASGEPFLFLNDLAFGPDGALYVTDSGILMEEVLPNGELVANWRDLPYDGRICRVDPLSGQAEILDRGFKFLNGLAFGPDGALYTAETLTGNIYRYAPRRGAFGPRCVHGNVIDKYEHEVLKGPDGMKFGANGHLYVCVFGQGDITVLDREGRVFSRLPVEGTHPTNLAFGPDADARIYVTEVSTGSVQVYEVETAGFELHD